MYAYIKPVVLVSLLDDLEGVSNNCQEYIENDLHAEEYKAEQVNRTKHVVYLHQLCESVRKLVSKHYTEEGKESDWRGLEPVTCPKHGHPQEGKTHEERYHVYQVSYYIWACFGDSPWEEWELRSVFNVFHNADPTEETSQPDEEGLGFKRDIVSAHEHDRSTNLEEVSDYDNDRPIIEQSRFVWEPEIIPWYGSFGCFIYLVGLFFGHLADLDWVSQGLRDLSYVFLILGLDPCISSFL